MSKIDEIVKNFNNIAILGHVNPDGDCIGSTLGLYNYLCDNFPSKTISIYLEKCNSSFDILPNFNNINNEYDSIKFDLIIILDSADENRIGVIKGFKSISSQTVLIDHHITNDGFCDINIIEPNASSASEVLFNLLDYNKISPNCASCLYMGIVHDSGQFLYPSTSKDTFDVAAKLISKNIPFTQIIEKTFVDKTYIQKRLISYVLLNSKLMYQNKLILGTLTIKELHDLGGTKFDIDGIVAELRNISNIEVAVFAHEIEDEVGYIKLSLRSKSNFDVSKIATLFGGGGHSKAAGFKIKASSIDEALSLLFDKLILD